MQSPKLKDGSVCDAAIKFRHWLCTQTLEVSSCTPGQFYSDRAGLSHSRTVDSFLGSCLKSMRFLMRQVSCEDVCWNVSCSVQTVWTMHAHRITDFLLTLFLSQPPTHQERSPTHNWLTRISFSLSPAHIIVEARSRVAVYVTLHQGWARVGRFQNSKLCGGSVKY